jgi:ADP-heptose:LPS heptosyltransferase
MEVSQVLGRILLNNAGIDHKKVNNVLVLHEFPNFFIGDICLRFTKLRALQEFFPNALIDINCDIKAIPLLHNNPFVHKKQALSWDEIAFQDYDVIVFVSDAELAKEHDFTRFIYEKYQTAFDFGIFSLPLFWTKCSDSVLPVYEKLTAYLTIYYKENPVSSELFITQDEITWGERWLKENMLNEDDNLVILVDSASQRSKLLNLLTYFEMVSYFSAKPKTKVLIFDEKSIGKKDFYRALIGTNFDKLIFAEGVSLRETLCIMSSSKIKLVFGPCTGVLHCASGIYYRLLKENIRKEFPVLITYVGKYSEDYNPWRWWENSLVDCLILKRDSQGNEIVTQLKDENYDGFLACDKYSSRLLIDFLESHYSIG